MSLLEVRNLRIEYPSRRGVMAAVKDLSFTIEKGEILGVVGESGAGKSTIGNAIIDLLSPPGRIASGDVFLNGKQISGLSPEEMRKVRGAHIGFIFQDPMTSLNPVLRIGQQITEVLEHHRGLTRDAATAEAARLLGTTTPQVQADRSHNQVVVQSSQPRSALAAAIAEEGYTVADAA